MNLFCGFNDSSGKRPLAVLRQFLSNDGSKFLFFALSLDDKV